MIITLIKTKNENEEDNEGGVFKCVSSMSKPSLSLSPFDTENCMDEDERNKQILHDSKKEYERKRREEIDNETMGDCSIQNNEWRERRELKEES